MANIDSKLTEWFKTVGKSEAEVKAKKMASTTSPQETPPPIAEPPKPSAAVENPPVREVQRVTPAEAMERTSDVAVAERDEPLTGAPRPVGQVTLGDSATEDPALFDDGELPPVEDFLSFLGRTGEAEAEDAGPLLFEVPADRRLPNLSEGTGEPKPISTPEPPVARQPIPAPQVAPVPPPVVARAEPAPVVAPPQPAPQIADESTLQEKWDRMPHHLQTLFDAQAAEEVAQNSYKTFRESRGDLIQRLLDPQISLEEAARILNVCPTTVRRYTNRGVLQHYRTAGNQRRFRLSDVLTFMENGTRGQSGDSDSEVAS